MRPAYLYVADQFHLDNDAKTSTLTVECHYVEFNASAHWVWHDPTDPTPTGPPKTVDKLPLCKSQCMDTPATVVGLRKNWDGKVKNKEILYLL